MKLQWVGQEPYPVVPELQEDKASPVAIISALTTAVLLVLLAVNVQKNRRR